MPKVRRKVTFDAVQFTQEMADRKEPLPIGVFLAKDSKYDPVFKITTQRGSQTVRAGNWIVVNRTGRGFEKYNDGDFHATYEPVDEGER